jgi:hypothetical protein
MPGRSYQAKPGLPSGCQVNIKRFYAKSTCLGSNYRNISSLTLVQKGIPGYLQRTVDNYSRAYLWLISHDLSHGVPLMLLRSGVRHGIIVDAYRASTAKSGSAVESAVCTGCTLGCDP